MDILKIIHEIAENEHEKYKIFKTILVDFCTEKKTQSIVFSGF